MSTKYMTQDDWNDVIGQGLVAFNRTVRSCSAGDLVKLYELALLAAELSQVAEAKRLGFAILNKALATWRVTIPVRPGRHMMQVAGIHPSTAKRTYAAWIREIKGDWAGQLKAIALGVHETVSDEYLAWVTEQVKVVPYQDAPSRESLRNGTEKSVRIKAAEEPREPTPGSDVP